MAKWTDILATVAPTLATALGGPLAGMAVTAAASALGLSDATQESVANALAGAKPSDLLALKQADYDLDRIAAGDRDSARQREINVKDRIPAVLAIGVTSGFFGILTFMLLHEVPASSKDVLNLMLGSLGTAWISVMSYYFGSSSGSVRKDAMLAAK
jgi:hypothetical protein